MKTQTFETIVIGPKSFISEQYEIIAENQISDCHQRDLIISGALLHSNFFKSVIFENCTFFGSKIENCQFVACQFINCKFQFSSVANCNFISCKLGPCQWETPYLQKNILDHCALDHVSTYYLSKDDNVLKNCFALQLPQMGSAPDFAA